MANFIDLLERLAVTVGQWLHPYLYDIALLLVVCLVSLYADEVLKMTKRLVSQNHFIVRVSCFVLVTGFGFGLMIVFVTPFVSKLLLILGLKWLPVLVLSAFMLLGILADRKKQL
ncbi:DUF3392 family protein [Pseudoalteromonas mariniglutinosa]|uniref:DUF3392 family protein n=1 Tax=Pseudoalteromonas mariniglutinosa TaxID=206042 RepID=UPI00384D26EE